MFTVFHLYGETLIYCENELLLNNYIINKYNFKKRYILICYYIVRYSCMAHKIMNRNESSKINLLDLIVKLIPGKRNKMSIQRVLYLDVGATLNYPFHEGG